MLDVRGCRTYSLPRIESWPLIKPVNDKSMMQLCPIATIDLFLQAIANNEPAVYELGKMNYLRALAIEDSHVK